MATKVIQIRVPQALAEDVKRRAEAQGQSVSEYVRGVLQGGGVVQDSGESVVQDAPAVVQPKKKRPLPGAIKTAEEAEAVVAALSMPKECVKCGKGHPMRAVWCGCGGRVKADPKGMADLTEDEVPDPPLPRKHEQGKPRPFTECEFHGITEGRTNQAPCLKSGCQGSKTETWTTEVLV